VKKISYFVLLLAGLLMVSCGDDDDGGTTGGSGETAAMSETAAQSAEQVEQVGQAVTVNTGSKNFSLLFEQTTQTCADCGVWFESAELVVQYTGDNNKPYRKYQEGNLLIKQSSGRVGRFEADLSTIPASATITQATLYMLLDPDEGIANADNTSVIAVYDYASGTRGALVRTITAAEDIKGRGYSKANPNVPIDFTAYASQVLSR
jgi:hypothetical protein